MSWTGSPLYEGAPTQGGACHILVNLFGRLRRFLGPERAVQQLWVGQSPGSDTDVLEQLLHLRPVSEPVHGCGGQPQHCRPVQPLQRCAPLVGNILQGDSSDLHAHATVPWRRISDLRCARIGYGCAGNSLATALQPSSDSNCSFLSYAWDNDYSCYAAQVISPAQC